MKKFRIWLIKRKLRSAYVTYRNMLDGSRAGMHMTQQLPSVAAQKARCNELPGKLAKLDPASCPISNIA